MSFKDMENNVLMGMRDGCERENILTRLGVQEPLHDVKIWDPTAKKEDWEADCKFNVLTPQRPGAHCQND